MSCHANLNPPTRYLFKRYRQRVEVVRVREVKGARREFGHNFCARSSESLRARAIPTAAGARLLGTINTECSSINT
jgi:hypothetical protein